MFLPLRDDTPRRGAPIVTALLIAVCVLVYLYQVALGDGGALHLARAGGVVPWEIRHLHDLVDDEQPVDIVKPPFTIFTSLFIHGDLMHLFGNMWFLLVFGARLEGYMGHLRFLVFFLAGGALAALIQVAAVPSSTMPMIGASGAVAALLGAYARAFARARVRCLVFLVFYVTLVELPASLLLGLWFLMQFISAGGGEPGVAWYAHIGGFSLGLGLGMALLGKALGLQPRPRLLYPAPWPRDLESW